MKLTRNVWLHFHTPALYFKVVRIRAIIKRLIHFAYALIIPLAVVQTAVLILLTKLVLNKALSFLLCPLF